MSSRLFLHARRGVRLLAVTVTTLALVLTSAAIPAAATSQQPESRSQSRPLSGAYIVTLKGAAAQDPLGTAADLINRVGGSVGHIYTTALKGFSARMSSQAAERLAMHPNVERVEQDGIVRISATQSNPPWGLDRIDQRGLPLDSSFSYGETGTGVRAYVIDTGLRVGHQEFGGRARVGTDTVGDGRNGVDCHGHGTHVAGTVGGSTYGVAKRVDIVGVRVLDCSGSGSYSGVIAGVDWVTSNAVLPAVVNMSLGGGPSDSLDNAIRNSIASGVHYVLAAGNDNANACGSSPARVSEALTVGASDSRDRRATFSNFGTCLDLFAPGVDVQSAWHSSDTATATLNGTSMAAPHVAGAVALRLEKTPGTSPADLASAVVGGATSGVISNPGSGSANALLYVEATQGSVSASPSSLSFGSVAVGTPSAAQTVTVSNGSGAPVTFGSATLAGSNPADFSITADTCSGQALAASGTCALSVRMTPSVAGSRSATASLPHDGAGSPISISLSGSGVSPTPGYAVEPGNSAFGQITVGSQSLSVPIDLSSTGTAPLTVGSVSLGGSGASQFLIISNACSGATLPPGQACRLHVRAAPTSAGSKAATLSIGTNAGTASVALSASGVSRSFSTAPVTLSFGTQALNTTTVRSFTLISTGYWLSVNSIRVSGITPGPFSIVSDGCTGRFFSGRATCDVSVSFSPSGSGFKDAGLTIETSQGTVFVPTSGTAGEPAPRFDVSPSSLTFPSTAPGSSAPGQTVTVTNGGGAPLTLGDASLTGANAAEFGKPSDNCSSATLAPGATCAMTINFVPVTAGDKAGALTISSNAAGSPHSISLSGVAATPAPGVNLSTGTLAFGSVSPGSTSPSQSFSVTNSGNANLSIGSVTVGGTNSAEFGKASDTCSNATIAPGASCSVGIVFAPVTEGSKNAAVSVPSNAAGSPHSVSLTGQGASATAPAVALQPAWIDFGNATLSWQMPPRSVRVTNVGDAPLMVGALSISGPNAQEFSISGSSCGSPVAPGSSCSISVRLTARTRGMKMAVLNVPSNAGSSPDSVPVRANVY